MKINEVTQSKVTRNAGGRVEIDHGDGTATTVDTNKNPQAISRDSSGKLTVNTNTQSNSAMARKKKQQDLPRPGEKIEIEEDED
jgi:ribonuclease PH